MTVLAQQSVKVTIDDSEIKKIANDFITQQTGLRLGHWIDEKDMLCKYDTCYHGSPDKVIIRPATDMDKSILDTLHRINYPDKYQE